MTMRDDPSSNGNAEPFDPEHPDVMMLAGVVARIDSELSQIKTEQGRQGRLLDKIALALDIEPDKSDPPPAFRRQLDSHREEIASLQKSRDEERQELEALRKVDAETTGSIKAVTDDVAATKLVIRVGLIEGIPKLVKVGVGLTGALLALAALGTQIWAAIHGH